MESSSLPTVGVVQASDGSLFAQGPLNKPAVSGQSPSAQTSRVRQAAQEFESILLHSWWQSMTESFGNPFEMEGDPAAESFGDLGLQAMSSAIAASGGIGLARMLLEKLHLEAAANNTPTIGTSPSPGDSENGTIRSPLKYTR